MSLWHFRSDPGGRATYPRNSPPLGLVCVLHHAVVGKHLGAQQLGRHLGHGQAMVGVSSKNLRRLVHEGRSRHGHLEAGMHVVHGAAGRSTNAVAVSRGCWCRGQTRGSTGGNFLAVDGIMINGMSLAVVVDVDSRKRSSSKECGPGEQKGRFWRDRKKAAAAANYSSMQCSRIRPQALRVPKMVWRGSSDMYYYY
jgi:hypothetical protein